MRARVQMLEYTDVDENPRDAPLLFETRYCHGSSSATTQLNESTASKSVSCSILCAISCSLVRQSFVAGLHDMFRNGHSAEEFQREHDRFFESFLTSDVGRDLKFVMNLGCFFW